MIIIEGMDISVILVFFLIMCSILYIFYKILDFIMKRREGGDNRSISNINQMPEGNSDPYARTGPNEDCAICTERIKHKVELDCSHSFCGKCIMDYYDSVRPNGLKCPLCRQNIRIINAENVVRDNGTVEFYDKIVRYNHRSLSGYNYYTGYVTDFSYLMSSGIARIFQDGLMTFYFIIILCVVIFYVISPYDIIPDTLGLIGYADDVSVVGLLAFWVIQQFYGRFRDRVEAEYHQIVSQ